MLPVAFEVLTATAPDMARKPAARADREGSTPFADMLDKPDTIDQGAPEDQQAPAPVASKPAAESTEPAPAPAATSPAPPAIATTEAQNTEAQNTEASVAPDVPPAEQEILDLLTAIAQATGLPLKPVVPSKADAKPAETTSDDQDDTAAVGTDIAAIVPVETQPADAAAVVVSTQATATAAAPEQAEPTSAGSGAIPVEPAAAKVVVTDKAAVAVDTKDAKPQAAAKADAPALAPDIAPDLIVPEIAKPAANPQAAQPAIQAHGQTPAAEIAPAPSPVAKPAPTHHDVRAVDVAAAKPADNFQPMVLLQNNAAAPAADQPIVTPASAAAPQAQAVTLPVAGIAVEIAGKALAGKNRFEIRLDPPELGRIHVRLDVDHKGEVTSIITADRSDTFDLLRRDAPALERALQDAGVKTSSNGLQFSLRDHGAGRHDQPVPLDDSARVIVRDDLDTEITAPVYRSLTGTRAGIDIRV